MQNHHPRMQLDPRWQYNQWANLLPLQQQHNGPRPLMQLNLGFQHGNLHPYHRQAEYNIDPSRAPGMGWGRRQFPYDPSYQMNRIQNFPLNMRGNFLQRNNTGISNNKPYLGNKTCKPHNTKTKSSNTNIKDKENCPKHTANNKEAKPVDALSKTEKDYIDSLAEECPVNSLSKKVPKTQDSVGEIDVIDPSVKESPDISASRKETQMVENLSKIKKSVIGLSSKELPMNSTSKKEIQTANILSKIEKEVIDPFIKKPRRRNRRKKETKIVGNSNKIKKDSVETSVKKLPSNTTTTKDAKTVNNLEVKESLINYISTKDSKTVDSLRNIEKDFIGPFVKEAAANSTLSCHDKPDISYRVVSLNVKKAHSDEEVNSYNNNLDDQEMLCMNISSSSENISENDDLRIMNIDKGNRNDKAKDIIQNKNDHITKESGKRDKPIKSSKRKLEKDREDHLTIKKVKESNDPEIDNMHEKSSLIFGEYPSITQKEVSDYCPNGHSLRKCYCRVNVKTDVISVFCKRCKIMIYMG